MDNQGNPMDKTIKLLTKYRAEGRIDDLEVLMADVTLNLAKLLKTGEIGMELFSFSMGKLLEAAGWPVGGKVEGQS